LADGYETSSVAMSFGLYALALNPDVQKKVREEVDSVLKKHGGVLNFDALQEMTYLDMALSGKTVIQSSQITFLSVNYNINLEQKIKHMKFNHKLCNCPHKQRGVGAVVINRCYVLHTITLSLFTEISFTNMKT
jgi:NAD(P)H-nitrite reductase large subunit